MSLKDLQENFQNYLCGVKNSITQLVVVDEKVPINIRLGIYKNAYEARLTECLSANYPKLLAYLGDEHFQNLAKKYIKAYPSNFHSIRWYGDSLAEFVADFYPQDLYLAELAEFEWKITLAFDAADDARMSVNEMATIPPEHWGELRFKRHPSVQILSCQWNTPQLWQALTEDLPLPESSFTEEPTLWLVWRTTDYFIKFISLTSVEAIIWSQLAEGQCFSALCELLCTWYSPEQVGMHAASYLKGWIERGLLASITS